MCVPLFTCLPCWKCSSTTCFCRVPLLAPLYKTQVRHQVPRSLSSLSFACHQAGLGSSPKHGVTLCCFLLSICTLLSHKTEYLRGQSSSTEYTPNGWHVTCHCSDEFKKKKNKILVFRRKIQQVSLKTFDLDCMIIFRGAYLLGFNTHIIWWPVG